MKLNIVSQVVFFLTFAFQIFYAIFHKSFPELESAFNISLGVWGVATIFLIALLISKDKVFPMVLEGFKNAFTQEEADKIVKRGFILLFINIAFVVVLLILFYVNKWLYSTAILATFLTFYVSFICDFFKRIRGINREIEDV